MRSQLLAGLILLVSMPAFAVKLTLNKQWINKHMNQATTTISMDVMDVKDRPNKPVDDGDIHMGGKSSDAGLPLVSEIMNAGLPPQKPALDFARGHSGKTIRLSGAWRLWFEHPPHDSGQVQHINGAIKMTRPKNVTSWTNPDHFFEVHPITEFVQDDGQALDLPQSVHFVTDIKKYDPATVFPYYESKTVTITEAGGDDGTITLDSSKSQYNYVSFVVKLQGEAVETSSKDGYFLLAQILDWSGKNAIPGCSDAESCLRRLVVLKDTEPYDVLKLANSTDVDGNSFCVLGIPRINLERVNYILLHPDEFDGRKVHLPYEMILVGAKQTSQCKAK